MAYGDSGSEKTLAGEGGARRVTPEPPRGEAVAASGEEAAAAAAAAGGLAWESDDGERRESYVPELELAASAISTDPPSLCSVSSRVPLSLSPSF